MYRFIPIFIVLLNISFTLHAQLIVIGTGGDFPTLSSAVNDINAGDTVLVLDDTYSDGTQFLDGLIGTASQPIVIMAETTHGVIFQGGTEAIHLSNCAYVELDGFLITGQTGNGINIDDGGNFTIPTHHITIRNCLFQDMTVDGNHDFLKLSGLDTFHIHHCQFINGASGGSGIDMVGCHEGLIEDCRLEAAGVSGIQAKGGTQFITIRRNIFKDMSQRAINIGGSTGLQYFRPPLPDPIVDAFESADIDVYSNIFIRSWAPIAFVGTVRSRVVHNTIYHPENWVIRILQETTIPGFLPCSENEFRNNIIVLESDLTEVNIGPNTLSSSFIFTNNLWFNENNSNWNPILPVTDVDQLLSNPNLLDPQLENFHLSDSSIAIGAGAVLDFVHGDFDSLPFLTPPSIGAFEGGELVASINTIKDDTPWRIFPNPTQTQLSISGASPLEHIQLWDVMGKLCWSSSSRVPARVISVENLPPGIYWIHLKGPEHKEQWSKIHIR